MFVYKKKLFMVLLLTIAIINPSLLEAKQYQTFDKSGLSKNSPLRVLFVGNSFSFFNSGIHNQVSNLIRASSKWQKNKQRFRSITISGGSLNEHQNIVAPFLANSKNKWDLVILQEYSKGPIIEEESSKFKSSAKQLVSDIRAEGSNAGLFMTWAYGNNPEMIEPLSDAYQTLGKELKVPVFPVGIAFSNAQEKFPDINLFSLDVLGEENGKVSYKKIPKHPSIAGSYLAACVFYSVFYGESAEGNPYIANLSENKAVKLQKIAWQTVNDFY